MTRRTIIIAAVYAVLAGVCLLIPLLKTFGFEYAFLFGLLCTVTAGPLTIAAVRPVYRSGLPARKAFVHATLLNLSMLGAPLLVMLAASALGAGCSLIEGLGFFALLPVVTVLFAGSLGYFCAVHYRRAVLIYWLIVVLTVIYALLLGYFTPAIFSYNVFYGYFPGVTYDELLPLTWTLAAFRAVTLGCAGLLVWMALLLERVAVPDDGVGKKGWALIRALVKPPRLTVTAGAALAVALLYVFRCPLGFETTEAHLRRTLGGEYRTEHFLIVYPPEQCDSSRIRRIADEHEFLLARLTDLFALGKIEPITSYLYPSSDVKQTLIGAGSTSIAKPWTRQVHVSLPSMEGVLGHELVHVVAGRFGQPVIRANLSTGLVEGLAMAVDGSRGERTFHQYAAAMRKLGIAPDITSLMSFWGFAAHSSSVSYVLAGSFCRYLIDRYGIRRIAQIYGSSNYGAVYGRSLADLVGEWQTFLDRVALGPEDTLVVDAYFRRPGVFGKVCPRLVARRNREAAEAFAQRQYAVAAARYRSTLDETGAYEALAGYLSCTWRLREYDSLITVYRRRVEPDPRPARYLSLFILFGDAFQARGDTAAALSLYRRVASVNPGAWQTEQALIRIGALAETDPSAYFSFLTDDMPDTVRLARADSLVGSSHESSLALYLRGRAAQRLERFDEALASFRDVDDRRLERPLRAARLWAAGECLFRLGRYQDAKIPFWESLNSMGSEARQEQVNEWVSRCDRMAGLRNH